MDEVIYNPYDPDRDEFVSIAKENISYFRLTDDSVLKRLFYKCK